MSSGKHPPTKDDLLRELESIRLQLESAKDSDLGDDIPILLDKVEQAVTAAPDDKPPDTLAADTAALQAAYQEAELEPTSKPVGKQEPRSFAPSPPVRTTTPTENLAAPTRPTARGENPFLPKHIRDRLHERRQALADIAQAASLFPSVQHATRTANDDYQAIVDELVAEYLPRLESELRARLLKRIREARESNDKDI